MLVPIFTTLRKKYLTFCNHNHSRKQLSHFLLNPTVAIILYARYHRYFFTKTIKDYYPGPKITITPSQINNFCSQRRSAEEEQSTIVLYRHFCRLPLGIRSKENAQVYFESINNRGAARDDSVALAPAIEKKKTQRASC